MKIFHPTSSVITAFRGGGKCTESLVSGVMPDKTLKAKVIVSLDELSGISFTTDINTWYPNDVEVLTNLATLIADLKMN